MRIRLLKIGEYSVDGRMLVDVQVGDDPLPVMVASGNPYDGSVLVGMVRAVSVDIEPASGPVWMTGELTVTKAGFDPVGLAAQADLDDMAWAEGPDGRTMVQIGRLRAIHLGDRPRWEGMVIEGG
jgi:hypothetical protein